MAKACWSKKGSVESNAVTSKNEDVWDAEAFFATEEELALTVTTSEQIDYEKDWIIDSDCSNHMTGNKEMLQNLSKYKGRRMVVTANNSKLPIAHIGNTVVSSQNNTSDVSLQKVYHILGEAENAADGDIKVAKLKVLGKLV
ncbi:hypothetical protein RJ641_005245 [Dillenia turbinata]|uniref:Retrovirus-related Pol polyprotein from transposon TNT 1-94-like beta-barrel domain-containing protein n=1 Tax=Dillenia turbinata TaxID=194707 RepID=A0AAN8ZBG1_9MAGN